MSIRGVAYNHTNRRWRASLQGYGRRNYIGEYLTEGEATVARRAAELALDGYEHEYPDIQVHGATARVPLMARRGKVQAWALIDTTDVAVASGRMWCMSAMGYAVARSGRRIVFLHRLVMPIGEMADHISGDKLDCRKANLRPANQKQNARNAAGKRSASGLKGVKATAGGRWTSRITVDRRVVHLGTFDKAEEAGRAYDRAAAAHFGEFARPNYPLKTPAERSGVDIHITPYIPGEPG